MQVLEAGGLAPLTDEARPADAGNPRGYYELEAAKRLPRNAGFLRHAAGRSVKIVHALIGHLPREGRYRVLWMRRDLGEVVRSQAALLERLGRPPEDDLSDARVAEILGQQLAEVAAALDVRPEVERLVVEHAELLADPKAVAMRVNAFLGGGLDVEAMVRVVDPALHRVRSASGAC